MDAISERACLAARSWWRESGTVGLIVALVLVAYFWPADELSLRGEEATRAEIAFEMIQRGDPIVPYHQGEPFMIRPPLQNWLIAASCLAFGNWDEWPIRFPSLLATLLTTLLIYGYSRSFLSRLGAFSAAAAFATFADMFAMGRQAETEALFIFLIAASLLSWHWVFVRRWPDAATYALGYGFMALAMLTKGLQAPIYFVGATTAYLVLTGQWRRLFSRGHLFGAVVGGVILLAWVIPYYFALGWSGVVLAWFGDPAWSKNGHIFDWKIGEIAVHLLTYTAEIGAGTLPWSLLLLLYCSRAVRRSLGEVRPYALFVAICLAVAAPTCWVPPNCLPRYFAPLYPCLAVLVGLVIERCVAANPAAVLRAAWRRYLATVAGVMLLVAVAVVVGTLATVLFPAVAPWAEPPVAALLYGLACAGLASAALRGAAGGPTRGRGAIAAVVCFMTLLFSGMLMNIRVRRTEHLPEAIAELKHKLPPGQKLVSLGDRIDSRFVYYYGLPTVSVRHIPLVMDAGRRLSYFCFQAPTDQRPKLPFAWEEIGTAPLDRNHHVLPEDVVVVGHRLAQKVSSGLKAAALPVSSKRR
jgi:4-amino-4-deoxy-L-arabinose transferase-like glycosyltransferase